MTGGQKTGAPSHKLDVDPDWYSAYTGLCPAASLSCESLLSDSGDKNPLKNLDYSKFMERAIPSYDVHKNSHRRDGDGKLIQDCPWCNHRYFEWLWANGDVRIVKQYDGADFTVYTCDGEQGEDGTDGGDIHCDSRYTFKPFLLKKKNRQRMRRKTDWIAKSKEVRKEIDAKSMAEVALDPTQAKFAKRPGRGGQDGVREWVSGNCRAHLLPDDMETYTVDRDLFFLPNKAELRSPDNPKYLIMCFDSLIPQDVQDGLWTRWCNMREKLDIAVTNDNRDIDPQLHLGIWSHYQMFPYITANTEQKGPVQQEVDAFLNILKKDVMQRVWNALKRHDPETLERHVQAKEHLEKDEVFMNLLGQKPELDFGGMFYTLAVKEGGSQTVHLDWKDHPGSYSWVLTVGPGWEGGEICFPQLGIKIATRPRQVIAFRGRQLAHFAAASTPGRLAITGFTDELTMGRALKGLPSQPPPPKVVQQPSQKKQRV